MIVRPARPEDYAAFVPLNEELGDTFPVPSEARWTAEMAPRSLIAEEDGVALGYVYGQALAESAHVRHLAVSRQARRRGVGRALLDAIAERFRAEGVRRWHLNVRPDNAGAIALYRSFGMAPRFLSISVRFPFAGLASLPAAAGEVGRVDPDEDAAIEAALGFLPGQLADGRTRPGRVLRALRQDGVVTAAGVLDPSFPGASPIRARGVGEAATLLRAFAPLAAPGSDTIFVFAEAAPWLADALIGAGGVEALRVVRYEGELDPA